MTDDELLDRIKSGKLIEGSVTCSWCGSAHVERIEEWVPALPTEQYMCLDFRSPVEWIRRR